LNIAKNFQEKFNQILRDSVPKNLSLAQEICELLDISLDSAYRRLRNETDYSIGEAMAISMHFDIPLESFNEALGTVASVRVNHLDNSIESYVSYLDNMLTNLQQVSSFEDSNIYFAAEDIPVFYHFSYPLLAKFKITYWLKSLLNVPTFQFSSFENTEIPAEILDKAAEIFGYYNKIKSTEIWTTETVLSTLKQIKYYWDAGFFDKKESAFNVLEELRLIIELIKRNTVTGHKFHKGSMTGVKHEFYLSDVMIGNNAVLVTTNHLTFSFISYSTFNFMRTSNAQFNNQNKQWLENLISKSTLLSTVAEKQRNQFFKSIFKQIHELTEHIDLTS
jgi:hypothetical protein